MSKTKQQKLFEENYKINRENNCFYSEFNSETLRITKIWEFNRNVLSQWADVDLLIGINKNTTNMKMKKGLTTIAKNLREIAEKLENGNYEITREYLEELLESDFKLNALINGGVDNWEYFDEVVENFNFDDVMDFIESID